MLSLAERRSVAACSICRKIVLYHAVDAIPDDLHFTTAPLHWPLSGHLHPSVLAPIASMYQEAARIKALAPHAFAGQIRWALEAICEDRGAVKGVLQKRLAGLAARGESPPLLAEMMDALRLLGNLGVHATDETIEPAHVHTIDDFSVPSWNMCMSRPANSRRFATVLHSSRITLGVSRHGAVLIMGVDRGADARQGSAPGPRMHRFEGIMRDRRTYD